MMAKMQHALAVAGVATLVLTPGADAGRRGTVTTYIGPDGGYWNNVANWDAGVPNGNFDAWINNDAGADVHVYLDTWTTVHNVRIDAGDSLTVMNNYELRLHAYDGTSTLNNAGSLLLDSVGSNTYLRFHPLVDNNVFNLTGGGEIVATGNGPNRVSEIYGHAILHNLDNTIRGGYLYLGQNALEIINDGVIVSDSGGTIEFDPPDGYQFGFTNTGTIRADGGNVNLLDGHYGNDGGVIEGLNGWAVRLHANAQIHGGILRGVNGGEVQAAYGASYLDLSTGYTPTIEGTFRIVNNWELRTYGPGVVNNTGTIFMDSVGSNVYLRCHPVTDNDVVTLTGGGEIVATGNGPNRVSEIYGHAILHNLDNTIRGGYLYLGQNALEIINDGVIVSDSGGTIEFDPPDGYQFGFTNTGTIRADGGNVNLLDGHYGNDGGVIEGLNGWAVRLHANAQIHGGILRGVNGGEVQAAYGASYLDLSTGYTPTIEGTFRIVNNWELRTYGPGEINNTGTILMDSSGSNVYLRYRPVTDYDVVTLTGGGEIVATGNGPNRVSEIYGHAVLHNLDNTIRGGYLYLGENSLDIINDGAIIADHDTQQLSFDPADSGTGLDNRGVMRATGAAGMRIEYGPFTTSGEVTVDGGSSLYRNQNYTQTAGSTTVDGTLTVVNGSLLLQGGTLTGTGTISGAVNNTGGHIEPGETVGSLAVAGSLTQSASGCLDVELRGTGPDDCDVLEITGNAALGGHLTLTPVDGFTPLVGDSFTILTATGTISGWLRLQDCDGMYEIEYTPHAVIVHVTGVAIPGDFNCDGCVNQSDLGILLAAYNQNDGGDIDGDGDTDQSDLGTLLSHYGEGC